MYPEFLYGPMFDIDLNDVESLDNLAKIAKDWLDSHPGFPGFHCVVPALGGPIMINKVKFY